MPVVERARPAMGSLFQLRLIGDDAGHLAACAEAALDEVEAAFFHDDRFDGFVTALTGRVEPRDGTVRLVSAGHPWPVEVGCGPNWEKAH